MRSRASLILMELTVMLLVLAASAALCLRGFIWADEQAQKNARCDRALTQVQSAAEVLQSCAGDLARAAALHGGSVEDGRWVIAQEDGTLVYAQLVQTDLPGLGQADLVAEYESEQLLQLQVNWQEAENEE